MRWPISRASSRSWFRVIHTGKTEPADSARFYLRAGAPLRGHQAQAVRRARVHRDRDRTVGRITVKPLDTVGADNGFAVGYLATLLTGR
jgi:sugar/nucleoside kinase (ribokinase family)